MHIDSRYPISHCFLLGGKRRACHALHIQAHVAIAAPARGTATPIHSLNHARSGSDRVTASTAPLCVRPRRSRLFPIVALALTDFHRVWRAVGPNWQGRKLLYIKEIGALEVSIAVFIAGVNRGSFDGGLDARVREIRFIQKQ